MANGIIITTEGEVKDFTADFELAEMYSALSVTSIELITLSEGINAYIDEEGRLNGSLINPVGTLVVTALGFEENFHGNILFTGGIDEEGYDKPLDPEQYALIKDIAEQAWTFLAEINAVSPE
jgi:hypothetical protein